jgi:hypothetical protein
MTVKCLEQSQKDFIAAAYRERVLDTDELAHMHEVSKRTVQRVLVEMGVNRARIYKGRKAKPHGLPIDMFEPGPTAFVEEPKPQPEPAPQPQPFIKRLWAFVKQAIRIPFL